MRLLIVDSLSSLISPILGGSGSHGKFRGIGELHFLSVKNLIERSFYCIIQLTGFPLHISHFGVIIPTNKCSNSKFSGFGHGGVVAAGRGQFCCCVGSFS